MKVKLLSVLKQYFLILIVLFILGLTILNIFTALLKNVTKSSIEEISQLSIVIVENEIEKLDKMLNKLADYVVIKDENRTISEKIATLTQFREENDMSDIAIGDLNGYIYSSTRTEGIFVGDRDYYLGSLQGKTMLSGPFESRADGDTIFVLSKPVYQNEEVVGVVVSIFRIAFLNEIISEIGFMDTGKASIIDQSGRYVADVDESMIGKVTQFDHEQYGISKEINFGEADLFGNPVFFRIQKIANTSWSLLVTVETKDIMGLTSRIQNVLLIILLVFGLSILIVNGYFFELKKRAKKSYRFSQNAINTAEIINLSIDENYVIKDVNTYFISHLGGSSSDYIGKSFLDLLQNEHVNEFKNEVKCLMLNKRRERFDLELTTMKGTVVFLESYLDINSSNENIIDMMGIDITERINYQMEILSKQEELTMLNEELVASEEEIREKYVELEDNAKLLKHIAFTDALTGLPNRLKLNQVIIDMIQESNLNQMKFCVILIDIDDFKNLNDLYGHLTGDQILLNVSNQLYIDLKDEHVSLFRIGGDEFVVLIESLDDIAQVKMLAEKIAESMSKTLEIEGHIVSLTVSMGVTLFPEDGYTVDDILKNADLAMYKAKEKGKNRLEHFKNEQWEAISNQVYIQDHLRNAIDSNQLELFYQPIYDLHQERTTGFEALLRWKDQNDKFISPAEFIPIAEKTGLIIPIGYWVLNEACSFMEKLIREKKFTGYVSVNISVVQLLQDDFVESVVAILEKHQIAGENIVLEITESIILESNSEVLVKLDKLHKVGIRFALDDFGEGYSSFSYLRSLPLKILKIDKSFVDHINTNSDDGVLGAIINVGQKLGLIVIAEGVETAEQVQYLRDLKCDRIQGYYYSKPLRSKELIAFLGEV